MPVAGTDQLAETIHQLKDAAESALDNPYAEDFEAFEKYLNEVDVFVRETQQAMWSQEAKQTLRRLESGQPLDQNDHEVLRTFIISDAEHYLAVENNYNDWVAELRRLMEDVTRRSNMIDRDSIGELRGVFKDAIRLVPDIRNYLEEKRRIAKFEEAMKNLDPSSRQMLAKLLRDQLTSPTR